MLSIKFRLKHIHISKHSSLYLCSSDFLRFLPIAIFTRGSPLHCAAQSEPLFSLPPPPAGSRGRLELIRQEWSMARALADRSSSTKDVAYRFAPLAAL